jgi:hypothetical protein
MRRLTGWIYPGRGRVRDNSTARFRHRGVQVSAAPDRPTVPGCAPHSRLNRGPCVYPATSAGYPPERVNYFPCFMCESLVRGRSRARLPSIASEGVPREPGPASWLHSPRPQSATGKRVGNDHAYPCLHLRTDTYRRSEKGQLEARRNFKSASPRDTQKIRTNFIWKSGDRGPTPA